MSRIVADVPAVVAHRMLKGWVLTDIPCNEPGCKVPLMRSPIGSDPEILFCANCDGPGSSVPPNPTTASSHSSESVSSGSHVSLTLTKEASSTTSSISSPVLSAPVMPTEESMRRRQQSDAASAEIGSRLLRGWAMLADECPNPRCYGVPLVRSPKAGKGNDGTKECVVCGSLYISRSDGSLECLVPAKVGEPSQSTSSNVTSPKTALVHEGQQLSSAAQIVHPVQIMQSGQGAAKGAINVTSAKLAPSNHSAPESASGTLSALEDSARSLEKTLRILSGQLTALSNEGTIVDFGSMGLVADAMYRVTQALGQVKQLQWSQKHMSYN